MLASHYAPSCRVELAADAHAAAALVAAQTAAGRRVHVHDPGGDLAGYARDLYGALRRADVDGVDVLVVVTPPAQGLGLAINDRLRRAAHRDR